MLSEKRFQIEKTFDRGKAFNQMFGQRYTLWLHLDFVEVPALSVQFSSTEYFLQSRLALAVRTGVIVNSNRPCIAEGSDRLRIRTAQTVSCWLYGIHSSCAKPPATIAVQNYQLLNKTANFRVEFAS